MNKKATFADAKVGDRVWSLTEGWGTIKDRYEPHTSYSYPLAVEFDNGAYRTYTLWGRLYFSVLKPTLFWNEIKYGTPEKPMPQLEVDARGGAKPTLVAWILYDATTDKKYIKMDPTDGSLAIFDNEEAAMSAKRLHSGTEYRRCAYYSAPQPVQGIRKLGIMGAAFDPPAIRRAYTYIDQPNNTTALKLGRVACKERSGGDFIDYGLQLLQHLQDEGFGVFEIDESDPTPQPAPEVAKLVEALEEMIDVAQRVDGWESFPSDPIERAEEVLALYRKQGGEL